MTQHNHQLAYRFVVAGMGSLATAIAPFLGLPSVAQIVPDATLGNESAIVRPDRTVRGRPASLIDGGAIRGRNLFQSFQEFNVGEGQRVYFANPAGIESILSRVTGANPSRILGLLGVDGSANLFLINPNGILFGRNARLDIAGSFVATTADTLTFDNGLSFSAKNPEAPPLLTVTLRPNLPYGMNYQGDISHAGNLAVGTGQTLSLQGKTVTSRGALTAPGGTVQLLGDRISVLDNARIDVSNLGGGGTVLIGGEFQGKGSVPNASQTTVDETVSIYADAIGTGAGGRVIIWANDVTQFAGKISARGGELSGNGGFVEVSGKQTLDFNGRVDTTAANGRTGTLLLDPFDFEVNDANVGSINQSTTNVILTADNNITVNAPIDITAFEVGLSANAGNNIFVNQNITTNAGIVDLTAGNGVFLNNVTINTNPFETLQGSVAGAIVLSGDNQVSVTNSALLSRGNNDRLDSFSGIGVVSANGSVQIDNSSISTTNFGSGFAGDVVITARDRVAIVDSGIFSRGNQGRIFVGESTYDGFDFSPDSIQVSNSLITVTNDVEAPGVINAGSIFLTALNGISIQNGSEISSTTSRAGDAGNITLSTSGLVSISDQSLISSSATASAQGNAGGVGISAGDLQILGKSAIETSTYTNSTASNVDSFTGTPTSVGGSFAGAIALFIDNDAILDDSTIFNNLENGASGQAGFVYITARSLSLFNGAQIQALVRGADANGAGANGNAGNILIGVDDTLKVIGRNAAGFSSAIFSSVEAGASGDSGLILITGRNNNLATSVQVRAGGTINVRNLSRRDSDEAGVIAINTRAIWLDNNASITAISESGQGGNVLLNTDALIIGRSSNVTSTSGIFGAGGSGGNIAIGRGNAIFSVITRQDGRQVVAPEFDARTLLIAGKTLQDNNILSQSFSGSGGNIRINVFRLQDIADRPNLFTRNDISTESFLGNSGTTVVNTLNIFPSFRVDPLPDRTEVPQISQGCDPRIRQESSQFTVSGRGGLPPNAADGLSQSTFADPAPVSPTARQPDSSSSAIAPARGWLRNPDGTIRLVAQVTDPANPIPVPLQYSPPCYVP